MAKSRNRWFWIIGSILVLGGLFAVGYGQVNNADATAAETGETAVAFTGDLAQSVSASGQIEAGRNASLSLATPGTVAHVNVVVGDTVKAGDVLVRLDTAGLERAVASAELGVAIARANLDDLLASASAEDIAAAEAAVHNTRAKLDDLVDGPSEQDIAASEATVRAAEARASSARADLAAANDVSEAEILAAEANLETALEGQEAAHNLWVLLADCAENASGNHSCTPADNDLMDVATQNVQAANAQVAVAQARLDELRNPDANTIAAAQASLSAAVAQYDAAVQRHDALLLGATDAEIASAQADLARAQASLDSLISGPSETDIDIYQIRVAQAETALREAQKALADASMVAPFDGIVTAVNVDIGEQAAGVAVELVDADSFELVLNVDQVDLGQLAVGQPAVVTLETWPDTRIDGVIRAIAPSSTKGGSGVVSYKVHLGLGVSDLPVRVGMTANADLLTARREGVLLVPNAAITADRQAGTYTVNRVHSDGTVAPVEVTVGLKDSDYTQIVAGLANGDRVLLGQLSAPTQQDFRPGQGGMLP